MLFKKDNKQIKDRKNKTNLKSKREEKLLSKKHTKTLDSTQMFVPIKDFYKGVIITNDNRFVKIIEVIPAPFELKSIHDQNQTYRAFKSALKSGPINIQFKSISIPPNIKQQLELLREDLKTEINDNCKTIDLEYSRRLKDSALSTVARRFFIAFTYEKEGLSFSNKQQIDDIVRQLDIVSSRFASTLKQCGNEVIERNYTQQNNFYVELFYILFNRNRSYDISYEHKMNDIICRYQMELKKENPYIPPYDFVAPDKISFTNSRYLVIDGMYYSFGFISSEGYPPYAKTGWLSNYINSYVGVDIDIFLTKKDAQQMLNKIRRAYNMSSVSYEDSSDNSEASLVTMKKVSGSQDLINGISEGDDFYYLSILFTVCDTDPSVLDYKFNELIKYAKTDNIELIRLTYQNEIAFQSSLPLCNLNSAIYKKAKRNVLTSSAATTYPFTSFEINDKEGIYFGDDRLTGSMAIVDIFNRQRFQNSNIFICGTTGAGKTYTLLLLALRMRIKHIPIFILSPEKEHEFRRVCDAVGGQFVQLGAGSPDRINIMEIFPQDDEISEYIDGNYQKNSQLSEKVVVIKEFIQLFITDMTLLQEQLLDDAIIATYKKFGITNDNNSLIDQSDPNKKRYKKMPILSDLQKELEKYDGAKSIVTILNFLTTGSGNCFNGQTNIDLNNEFTVFGLEKLEGKLMPLGIYIAMDFVWSKIKQDRTKRKVLMIDEWWKMAFNPIAAEYSLKISKIIRAYNGAMILATQQMTDILAIEDGKFGAAVLNNCAMKILLRMTENDAEKVQSIMRLTDEETRSLITSSKGQALFTAGATKMSINFIASKTENRLITTDSNELKRIAEETKQQQELERQRKIYEEQMKIKQEEEAKKAEEERLRLLEEKRKYEEDLQRRVEISDIFITEKSLTDQAISMQTFDQYLDNIDELQTNNLNHKPNTNDSIVTTKTINDESEK